MDELPPQPKNIQSTQRGFGLPVSIGTDIARRAAIAVEEAKYHSFWLNNPPQTNALDALQQVAQATSTVWLGIGIIPLSDQTPDSIARQIATYRLPIDRFYLGIGSGSGPSGVERVADGLRTLRTGLECHLVAAALGPAMCRLAGELADGVLLNWLTPSFARRSMNWIREGAEQAGRDMPRVMAYVRLALGDEASVRLQREAANYAAIPQYAKHFTRMGLSALDTTISAQTSDDIQHALAAWDGIVDEVVLRAIPAHDTIEDVLAVVQAAQPRS